MMKGLKHLLIFLLVIKGGFAPIYAQPISRYFTAKNYQTLFPNHASFYSYAAFIKAATEMRNISVEIEMRDVYLFRITRTDELTKISKVVREDSEWNESWAKAKPYRKFTIRFADFCNNGNLSLNKKELAAFFAQSAHETKNGQDGNFNSGLIFIHEIDTSLAYKTDNKIYPAVAGKKYYGRGPLQLSYNGNYGFASSCIYGDQNILLNNPEILEKDAVAAFKTAIYFWMTPQSIRPSAHQVMTGLWKPGADDQRKGRVAGFGMVTNIINGALECNQGEKNAAMQDRIGFYKAFLKRLGGTDANCNCSCGTMQSY
ncbi:chitinase [Pedobacter duraquae]|uniref:Chitinase class I n=1 Tax=Pedobacter duraquae TaxID=425511 RepID=A0A4R6ILJ5_9SPHI|nr:chitinase [Pedobacter duraquae]TDO22815.1 chitinase class I [Pedobacter duraquae]